MSTQHVNVQRVAQMPKQPMQRGLCMEAGHTQGLAGTLQLVLRLGSTHGGCMGCRLKAILQAHCFFLHAHTLRLVNIWACKTLGFATPDYTCKET